MVIAADWIGGVTYSRCSRYEGAAKPLPFKVSCAPGAESEQCRLSRRTGVVARGADNETTTDVRNCECGFLGRWLQPFEYGRADQADGRTA